jgi:hypothetical protein
MRALSQGAIDNILKEVTYGFLGLARENQPYVIPMAFGYDEDNLYFQMNSQGRKFEYIDGKTAACLTVLSMDGETGVSKSIIIEGDFGELSDERTESAFEALASNANFGTDLSLWGMPLQDADPTLFVLRPDDVTGRVFGEH